MKTQDRLSELNKPSGNVEIVIVENNDTADGEGSLSPEFLEEVGQIRSMTSLIRRNIKSIQDTINKQSLSTDKNTQTVLDELFQSTNSSANKIRIKLKAMKEFNDKLPSEDPQKHNRTHMHRILTQKFMVLVSEYQIIQNNYKEKSREKVQKQAEIVKPGVSRDEVDQMIDTGTGIFADQVLSDQKHAEAKNALLQIHEQQKDLRQLEHSIQELNQLFIDMQTMVEASSIHVENVEQDFGTSVVVGTEAVSNVGTAFAATMLRRKRVAMATTAIVVVLVIVAAVIALILAHQFGAF